MGRLLSYGLATLLLGGALRADDGVTLHLSRLGETPAFISMALLPGGPVLRAEAAQEHVMSALALPPKAARARLTGDPAEPGQPPIELGEVKLPDQGRHLLLLWPGPRGDVRTTLFPTDALNLPKGGVSFLNLTSRRLRCFLDAEHVEVPAGGIKLHPAVSTGRRIVNHRLQVDQKGKWEADSSTTLILKADRRMIIVFTEDGPKGPLRRTLVTDYAPDANMAPVARPEPPVTVAPPLPDPPAK
jgi:hypothetical protein